MRRVFMIDGQVRHMARTTRAERRETIAVARNNDTLEILQVHDDVILLGLLSRAPHARVGLAVLCWLCPRRTRAARSHDARRAARALAPRSAPRRHHRVRGIPHALLSRLEGQHAPDLSPPQRRTRRQSLGRRGQREHRLHRARFGRRAGAARLGERDRPHVPPRARCAS